ncbi:acyl-CoA N-acyltransferase [Auriculariales sp. MPI-PUGE-AT-0066]|nr:acyl-CoA N-acyltransferase [Auriculariales sp. MPI-PUGE-AT-0066]
MTTFTLQRLAQGEEHAPSDNTPAARASRAPRYALSTRNSPDEIKIYDILGAFFDSDCVETVQSEWVRLQLPQAPVRTLAIRLVRLGVAVPFASLKSGTSPCSAVNDCDEVLLIREAFWQLGPEYAPWLRVPQTTKLPLSFVNHYVGASIVRAPVRPLKPAASTIIYSRYISSLGKTFTLRVLNVNHEQDVATFSEWQNNPRVAAGWLQNGTLEEHRNYLLEVVNSLHSIPLIGAFDGADMLYTEFYWVKEDPLAPLVRDVDPFDRGFHFLVGSEQHRGPRYVKVWPVCLAHALFLWDSRTQRVLMEPRLTNEKAIRTMERSTGFIATQWVDFPHKRSALLELTRERFFALSLFTHGMDLVSKL